MYQTMHVQYNRGLENQTVLSIRSLLFLWSIEMMGLEIFKQG